MSRVGRAFQACLDEAEYRRTKGDDAKGDASPSRKRSSGVAYPSVHSPRALLESGSATDADSSSATSSTSPPQHVKLVRKCGTPGCTLPDWHDGPCSCTLVSGRRTIKKPSQLGGARGAPLVAAPAAAATAFAVREQQRLTSLVQKRGTEPPWKLDTPSGETRRAHSRRRGSISLNAAERREAAASTAQLRGWGVAERELFALGLAWYGKDLRAIRHALLPARQLPELVEYYYLRPGRPAAAAAADPGDAAADPAAGGACCECASPLVDAAGDDAASAGALRCTAAAQRCPNTLCARCRGAAPPEGDPRSARAPPAFWLCAPCAGRVAVARAPPLAAVAHAACLSCAAVKPRTLLAANPWLRAAPTCSECLARFAVPVSRLARRATAAAPDAADDAAADGPLGCQWCAAREGAVYACSEPGCPHAVCVRCLARCVGPERVEALGADEAGAFRCALHDGRLEAAAVAWTARVGPPFG